MTSKKETRELINKLLSEIEEEDVGVSLLTTFYANNGELEFFGPEDRKRVQAILKQLADDSARHKIMLESIVTELEKTL